MVESDTEGESKMKRASCDGKEENEDRLSDLPDCILLHILSFMNTKHVVQTCVLSKRWKDLWKHVPALVLHSSQFWGFASFKKFVTMVLCCRDDSAALCNLDFDRCGYVEHQILKRMLRYAVSHNVQQMRISAAMPNLELPPSIFSCQSLTSLELSIGPKWGSTPSTLAFPKSLSLTALTNLHLEFFAFCPSDDGQAEPFSNCKKLHSLVIKYCTLSNAEILCISNARVANLVMRECDNTVDEIVLSTPNLRSFSFTTCHPPKLIGSNLSFLEEVYIDANFWPQSMDSSLIINSWFQVFTDAKSMALTLCTLQVLSLIPDLQNTQSTCLGNLNSLAVLIKRPYVPPGLKIKLPSPTIPYGVVNYLIQNSPSAEVTVLDWRRFFGQRMMQGRKF